ncbi:MAG TPA: RING-HC finger protein [bacterium]|nr:RING-HC finger protein [bacterium]
MLTGIGITILFFCGIIYINRGRKREVLHEKIMMLGFGSYFIGLTFQRLFGGYLGHFFVEGTFTNYMWIGSFDPPGDIFQLLFKIDYILWAIGAAMFILAFEIGIKKTKYILTIIQIPLIILIIILPYGMARNIQRYFMYPFSTTIIIASIVLIGKWSRFELKAISSMLFFGVVFLMMSSALVSKSVKELNIPIMLYLSPIFFIIGALVVMLPLVIDLKSISHMLRFLSICGIFTIITMVLLEIFLIYLLELANVILYIFILVVVIFLEVKIIKDTKSYREEEAQVTGPIILEMFTKPQKITEEDVTVSIEKKICLVCKNKISGLNYICSDCGTFYCTKCSNALSDLENVCWACNTPIDISKPYTPFETEDESSSKDKKSKKGEETIKQIAK